MRPSRLAIVLALCCVLAGCNALAPGERDDDSTMPSVTPADLPEDDTESYPPGLAEGRLVDGSALLTAHADAMTNRSVVVERRSQETAFDGTTMEPQVVVYRFGADREHVSVTGQNVEQRYEHLDLWANESTMLFRYGDDDPRYERERASVVFDPSDVSIPYGLELGEVRGRSVNTTYLGERDGDDRFRVTMPWGGPDGEQNTFVVDEHGFISAVDSQRVGPDGETTETAVRVSFAPEGLDRPEWVSEAYEAIENREYVVPGVTADRIVSTQAMAEAHADALGNTSGTYVHEERRVQSDGTLLDRERVVVERSNDPTRYSHTAEHGRPERTYHDAWWSNGTVAYRRSGQGDDADYERVDGSVSSLPSVTLPDAVETGTTRIDELDGGRHRITVTDYYDDETRQDERHVVVVDERGFVYSVEENYTVDSDTPVRVSETTRYTNLGTTIVERPDWLSEAVEATRPTVELDETPANGSTVVVGNQTDESGVDGTTTATSA